uniref:Uncharacterized protein n=1 Tax=Pseudo-nitzschia australis TaxID=44445 RepID=A0A7S4AH84_9STRA
MVAGTVPTDCGGLYIVHWSRMALNPDVALLEERDDLAFQSSYAVDARAMDPESELDFVAGSDDSVEVKVDVFVSPVFQKLSRGENQAGFAGHELNRASSDGDAGVEEGSKRD